MCMLPWCNTILVVITRTLTQNPMNSHMFAYCYFLGREIAIYIFGNILPIYDAQVSNPWHRSQNHTFILIIRLQKKFFECIYPQPENNTPVKASEISQQNISNEITERATTNDRETQSFHEAEQ